MEPDVSPQSISEIEGKLERLFGVDPDPAFAGRLDRQIASRLDRTVPRSSTLTGRLDALRGGLRAAGRYGLSLAGLALLAALIVFSIQLRPQPGVTPGGVALTDTPFPDPNPIANLSRYTVRARDTWAYIADAHSITIEELLALNGLRQTDLPYVGQSLLVPAIPSPQPTTASGTYIVREGDTWFKIAAEHGLSVEELAILNGLQTTVLLEVGQPLIVGGKAGAQPVEATPTPTAIRKPEAIRLASGVCPSQPAHTTSDAQLTPMPPDPIGGASVETGDFTIDLWLYCDSRFSVEASNTEYKSEIEGLGMRVVSLYHGARQKGHTRYSQGFVPYIQEMTTTGARLDEGSGSIDTRGILFPPGVYADLSGPETPLRFVYQIEKPDGTLAGAVMDFTLKREAGGYRPVDVEVRALTAAELAAGVNNATDIPAVPTREPPAPVIEHPVLAELYALVERRQEELTGQPGWLHVRYHKTSKPSDDTITLPNGAPIPPEVEEDFWYLVDEEGTVTASVTRTLDPAGLADQIVTMRDGIYRNLSLGFEMPVESPHIVRFDYGFSGEAARAVEEGADLVKEPLVEDGQPAAVRYILTSGGYRFESVFDAQTGQFRSHTRWYPGKDGLEIVEQITLLSEERVDRPPAEVLDLLDQETPPYRPIPPLGTPAPQGFDPTRAILELKSISGDDIHMPSFWYGDIYARGYLLGRVDFGGVPGGWCDRSADGARLAFGYEFMNDAADYESRVRWFDLNAVEVVHDPAPDLNLISYVAWAPVGHQLAFSACKPDRTECGLYVLDTDTDQVRLLVEATINSWEPIWKPDGTQLAAFAYSDGSSEDKLVIVDVATGNIIDPQTAGWKVSRPTSMDGWARCAVP